MSFCHLHVHDEYSQLDGMGTAKEYVAAAKENGFKYLGLTNHGNIDSLIKFQRECEAGGITPVLGCEAYIVDDIAKKKTEKRHHICLFVKNQRGWRNLTTLMTFANIEGFYYRPIIDYGTLLKHCEGLVISTACAGTFLHHKNGIDLFEKLNKKIGSDLYLEVMPHDIKVQYPTNKLVKKLSKKYGNKIIATNDCHYVLRSDHKVQDVLLAIQRQVKWNDPKRFSFGFKGLHLRTEKEMIRAFKKIGEDDYQEWLDNTIEVAKKCSDFKIKKRTVRLPEPKINNVILDTKGKESNFLWALIYSGYEYLFGIKKNLKENKKYYRRAKREFELLQKKGFIHYLLIVWELIDWCEKNNIIIGPGRGSVGGSLIAYLIGITQVDPIKYGLYFERFVSEDRVDLPDIDIDFDREKRYLVVKHLEELYGEDNVCAVSSFNRMKSRAAIGEVGKVFGVPDYELKAFSKLIDYKEEDALKTALDTYPEGQALKDNYPFVVKAALRLEGQIRNYGKHAAAIVVSKRPIAKGGRCNLIRRNKTTLINWGKEDTEFMGLMKFDLLSLSLLSIYDGTKKAIKENHGIDIDFKKIPLDDKKVLKNISDGNNVGVFQIGTWATNSLIQEMHGVRCFDDIAAAIALVRPGPMQSGMTEQYIERRQVGEWEQTHKIYDEITEETNGVLVYQEQVMAVISKMAGLPYSTADQIRKIIGKKRDPKEFETYRKQFLDGCIKQKTFSKKEAKEFWEGLLKWAKYGFGKAHSIEYALLGYWCAFLKLYYPLEFICANLTYGSDAKKTELVEEIYDLGLKIELPKVGISEAEKWVTKSDRVFIPFAEIKGVGPVLAREATAETNSNAGLKRFYNPKGKSKIQQHPGKLGKILQLIGAYGSDEIEITKEISDLFDFRIEGNNSKIYKNLWKVLIKGAKNKGLPIVREEGLVNEKNLKELVTGDIEKLRLLQEYNAKIIKRKSFRPKRGRFLDELKSCNECELREECTSPVPPSSGKLNVIIAGEAPGKDEDEKGVCFVGRTGNDILWPELKKYGFERSSFHVTNIDKCFPKKSRKPSPKQIQICANKFFKKEVKQIRAKIILAFGNTNLFLFTGNKGGITDWNGKIMWNEEYAAWIFFCLHPASVLHNPDNKIPFKKSIKQFAKYVNEIKEEKQLKTTKHFDDDDIPF